MHWFHMLTSFIHRSLHTLFPSLCVTHAAWDSQSLLPTATCPVCGRFLGYQYSLGGNARLHVAQRYQPYMVQLAISAPAQELPKSLGYDASIDWDALRTPAEPLLSDLWGDDEAYQRCAQAYLETASTCANIGLSIEDCDWGDGSPLYDSLLRQQMPQNNLFKSYTERVDVN